MSTEDREIAEAVRGTICGDRLLSAEQSVLGVLMYDPFAMDCALASLGPLFYIPLHKVIFAAIATASLTGMPDPVAVWEIIKLSPECDGGDLRYLACLVDDARPARFNHDVTLLILTQSRRDQLDDPGDVSGIALPAERPPLKAIFAPVTTPSETIH